MRKQEISTDRAPRAIGPYSQAIAVNSQLYVSGQIPLDPHTGSLECGGIESQARRIFHNLAAIAEEAGTSLDATVKLSLFLVDIEHFRRVNNVMAELFAAPYPARSCVQVAALPRGAQIEVDAIMQLD